MATDNYVNSQFFPAKTQKKGCPKAAPEKLFTLRLDAAGRKVLFDHERDLEGDGVVELTQVESRELLDLFKTVDKRISVDEQLARRFREDQVILEELVDREERLLVERIDRVLLENLLQEHFAQCRRQLINNAADAEVVIVDDRLLVFKHVYRRSIPGTRLEGSALEIEIIEASAKCRNCGSVFNPFTCDAQCPCCQESEYTVLSGKEFLIKEILAC